MPPSHRILITGPESSGKSTLARQLADEIRGVLVPEYARNWMEQNGPDYDLADLIEIAHGQLILEENAAQIASDYLVCDTGPLVLKIWAEYRFGQCPEIIEDAFRNRSYDYILLCKPDLHWQPDPLRENPHDREELFGLYRNTLMHYGKSFSIISGTGMDRLTQALAAIGRKVD